MHKVGKPNICSLIEDSPKAHLAAGLLEGILPAPVQPQGFHIGLEHRGD